MGFEPRAAERLRLAVASAGGALDEIAPLIGTPSRVELDGDPVPRTMKEPALTRTRERTRR